MSRLKYVFFTFLGSCLLCLSHLAHAQVYAVAKWEVIDIPIKLKQTIEQPFQLNANAIFTHSDGDKMTVPIFYDGNNRWLIRFSASKQGQWQFITQSESDLLKGQTGEVIVEPAKADNHGAIVLNQQDKQNFYYEDGTPYFLLGFEMDWLYALDYHNQTGTPKSEHFLSILKQNGFNQIVMNVFSYDVSWEKDERLKQYPEHDFGGPKDIFPFLGNNDNPDYSALNVEFFQKLDRSVQLLHDKRMVAHLMIYVWNKLVNWPDMNTQADNMYFDYVVKRYQAYPNVIWDISKEALFYGRADEAYIKNRIERLRAINYYKRLVTVHDYKYCSKYPEQVDFISTQDWGSDIYNLMINARNKFKDKPVYNIEHGGYEESPYLVFPGDYTDPEVSLRRNWLTQFAGVYSTYYWQAAAWNVIIYNPYQQPADFIIPRFDYFKHLNAFFERFTFADFKPIPWKNGSAYTMMNDKETYLIYVPKENYQFSRGDWYLKPKEGGKNKRSYQWFNTLTGEYTPAKIIKKDQLFISPWRGEADAVLVSELIE